MQAIYDQNGFAVGWYKQSRVMDLAGRHQAFLEQSGLYSYSGRHLGFLTQGYFTDLSGEATAFLEGAQGGPVLPQTSTPPLAPLAARTPVPAAVPTILCPPPPVKAWSDESWRDLFNPPATGIAKSWVPSRVWSRDPSPAWS